MSGKVKRGILAAFLGLSLVASLDAMAGEESAVAKFIKIKWPSVSDVAPDGTMYLIHNPDGISQLYKVAPGKTQHDAVKLTEFTDGISGATLSDDGKWMAVTAAVGGSEQTGLFLLDTATGKMESLYLDPKIVFESPLWRRDSKALAFRANDESSSDFYVYVYDIGTKERKKVFGEKGSNSPVDWTRDGSRLMVSKYTSPSYSQLFEVELSNGKFTEITPKDEQWYFEPVGYTKDESHFIVNSNYQGDLNRIHTIALRGTPEIKPVLSDLEGREIDGGLLDPARTTLAVMVNEDGYSALHLRDATSFKPKATPKLDKGLVGIADFDGPNLYYSLNNANTAGVTYRWNMNAPDAAAVALTEADTQGIDLSKFRLPELIHYESFDGKKIPAFVYLPDDYQKGKKIPFIAQYHGGPEAQFRPSFNRQFQYFVSRGFGVIAPNPRGSSGYGKEFVEADNYKNREKSVKDGIWAVKWLIDNGYTDKRMVAAWGGSYGGFMTMAVITEAPELFGAACNVVGIVNFETFLEQTKDYRRALREVEYGPLTDREFLKSISPIYKVDKIDMPLMLAHGLNDPRVPIGEAMQVAVALKKRGVDVEELYFPDEGHGFAKEDNRLLYFEELARFFEKHLKKG